jgi:hypothetical protein
MLRHPHEQGHPANALGGSQQPAWILAGAGMTGICFQGERLRTRTLNENFNFIYKNRYNIQIISNFVELAFCLRWVSRDGYPNSIFYLIYLFNSRS